MEFLDRFYANFFTVGALIPTTFYMFLAYIFLSIKKKSSPTFHLGIAFLYLAIFNLGYFIAGGFYHPDAAYHRWITVGFILLHESHINMFMLNINNEVQSRGAKIFLAAQYAVSIAIAAVFIITTLSAEKIFVISAHHWDFTADGLSRIIGLLIIAYLGVFILITAWKVWTIKSKVRYYILLIGIAYLIASIVPSLANILSRNGLIDRGTFQVLWDLFSLGGLYILLILYLNYTQDRAPIMSKVVSIIIVTILLILQGFSYYSFQDNEKAYDTIHQAYTELTTGTGRRAGNPAYTAVYPADTGSAEAVNLYDKSAGKMNFQKYENEYLNAAIYQKIDEADEDGFPDALKLILDGAHPAYNGYKNALAAFVTASDGNGKKLKSEALGILKKLQTGNNYHSAKIGSLPDTGFRDGLKKYLAAADPGFAPFKSAIEKYIDAEKAEGVLLKSGVLGFMAQPGLPAERHYRSSGNHHFISFLHADTQSKKIHEVGFTYESYRAFLHPSAVKFINALFVIFVVTIFGFNLFFRGVLIIPLHRLVSGFRDISAGRLDTRIPVKLGDELGFASANFNNMADIISRAKQSLDEYTDGLEQKVEERTRELTGSEERYRNILDNIQDGYYEVDLKGEVVFINNAMATIMGYQPDEILNHSYSTFTDAENSELIFKIFQQVFKTGIPSDTFDYRIIQKDGTKRITEAVASLITAHDGTKTGFRGILRDITERRSAEEDLKRSEEKFRSILNAGKIGYYETDLNGCFTYCNSSFLHYTGFTEEEMPGSNFREYVVKEDIKNVMNEFGKVFFGKTNLGNIIISARWKSGELTYGDNYITPKKDSSGRVDGFSCVVIDNTERKKAEEALRESEEKYRSVLDSGVIGYYETDMQGNFTYCNISFTEWTGYPPEELTSMNFRQLVNQEDINNIMQDFIRVMKGDITVSIISMRVLKKDGCIVYGENYVSAIRNSAGQITGFRGVGIDTTERRNAEAALRNSEEKYRTFVESATDGIFRNDISGNFLYVNPSGQQMLGYSEDELLAMNYRDLVSEENISIVVDHYRQHLSQKLGETYLEFPVITKDADVKWLGQKTKLVKISEDTYEFHGISRDVTERRKAEDAHRELEEQKTRFFANISHEIRTPLTLMLSPIESVIQGDYGNKINRAFFNNLYRNGLRLLKLVNNLLDFSKIEAGRMKMKVSEINLASFVRNYISAVHSAAESNMVGISFSSGNDHIPAYIDIDKMDKVVMNLFSNALKFTGRGGTITVRVWSNGGGCFIEFRDTGEGIPARSIETIFDRFSQADTSATRKHEGTGIGLALAKELVEMHSGKISVASRYIHESPDDHGTVFTVEIPGGREHFLEKEHVEFITGDELGESVSDYRFFGMREMHDLRSGGDTPPRTESDQGKPAAAKAGAIKKIEKTIIEPVLPDDGTTILIVDDNSDMRDFLSYLLKKHYAVHLAENGQDGIEAVGRVRPDLIITDVMMPVMDGHEMTIHLKNDPATAQIPIIMLTAKAEMANKLEGLEQGADDFLTKPFNSKELMARIRTLLKTKKYEKEISRRNNEIEQEMEVARLLQHRLLPEQITELSGYESHAVYIPMDKVGGDFYDYTLRDRFIDLFIADVSGHGLPGAFLAMMTKMTLESTVERQHTNKVMYSVNEVICRSTVNSNYVTAFLCTIDTGTNLMRYSNAGHLPPIVCRKKSGEIIELKTKGMPLGWFKNVKIEEKEYQLHSGDRLILFTDGITESINPEKEMFGDEGFREFILANREMTPQPFCEKLLLRLREYSASEKFDDDLTLVVFDVL